MVAEDDPEISYLLGFLLSRQGYEVSSANDGRAALALINETPEPFAMAIFDIMMPYADGFALIDAVRTRDGWSRMPILMLTAKSQEADIVRALETGADDYMVKPFQPGELIARVKRMVSAR